MKLTSSSYTYSWAFAWQKGNSNDSAHVLIHHYWWRVSHFFASIILLVLKYKNQSNIYITVISSSKHNWRLIGLTFNLTASSFSMILSIFIHVIEGICHSDDGTPHFISLLLCFLWPPVRISFGSTLQLIGIYRRMSPPCQNPSLPWAYPQMEGIECLALTSFSQLSLFFWFCQRSLPPLQLIFDRRGGDRAWDVVVCFWVVQGVIREPWYFWFFLGWRSSSDCREVYVFKVSYLRCILGRHPFALRNIG